MSRSLKDMKIGEECKIKSIELASKNLEKQLKNLGFMEGEKIKIIKINYGDRALLVKVFGVNYVVDSTIAQGIFVE